jgi:hypothetical protein
MELNKQVKEQWERLFKHYENNMTKKCEGATEEKIREVEETFSLKLPKAFADSFRICDDRYILKDTNLGFFGDWELYSITHEYHGYHNLITLNKDMREYGGKDEWIVFYDYETWFHVILDTKTGQIYLKAVEDLEYIIWANSYEEWLKIAVDEVIEHGEIRLELIEGLLGIV